MKATGIVKPVDELGRILIPMELRKTLNIAVKDALEIYTEGDTILLKKFELKCILCGNPKAIISFKDKFICKTCIKHINSY